MNILILIAHIIIILMVLKYIFWIYAIKKYKRLNSGQSKYFSLKYYQVLFFILACFIPIGGPITSFAFILEMESNYPNINEKKSFFYTPFERKIIKLFKFKWIKRLKEFLLKEI